MKKEETIDALNAAGKYFSSLEGIDVITINKKLFELREYLIELIDRDSTDNSSKEEQNDKA